MSESNLGDVVINDELASLIASNPSSKIGWAWDPELEKVTWVVLGGSGSGVQTEGSILDWYVSITGLVDGSNLSGATEYGSLYAADGSTILEFDPSDLDADGFEIGDDYLISRTGADVLYFKTPGLYLADITASAIADVGVRADYSNTLTTSFLSVYGTDSFLMPAGQLLMKVKESDVSSVGNLVSGLSLILINRTGSNQDLHAEAFVSKIG